MMDINYHIMNIGMYSNEKMYDKNKSKNSFSTVLVFSIRDFDVDNLGMDVYLEFV